MPMLHPCPRCTQVLPVSATFCRRCGLPVAVALSALQLPVKSKLTLTIVLSVLLIGAIGVVGIWSVNQVETTPPALMAPPSYAQPLFSTPSVPPAAPIYDPAPALQTLRGPIMVDPRVSFFSPGRGNIQPSVEHGQHEPGRDHGR